MRKPRATVCISLVFLVICPSTPGGAAQPQDRISPARIEEYRLRAKLCESTATWLKTREKTDGAACDQIMGALLALDRPTSLSCFLAAQVAWVRGQPDAAIAALNGVLERCGEERSPIGVRLPVKVVGHLWIASIARYSGSMASAKKAYETVLSLLSDDKPVEGVENKSGLMSLCYLYLAEMEANHRGNPKQALSYLAMAEAESARLDSGRTDGTSLYRIWVRYERVKLARGRDEANRQLAWDRAIALMPLLAGMHLTITGLTTTPFLDCCERDVQSKPFTDAILKRATENTVSNIDRTLACFLVSHRHESKGELADAARGYAELLDDNSFISPVAGTCAVRIMRAEGRVIQAEDLLRQVSAQYPQFVSGEGKAQD